MIPNSKKHQDVPPEQAAIVLEKMYGSKLLALQTAVLVKSQVVMYTGNLNPKWLYWEQVIQTICPNITEDEQRRHLDIQIEVVRALL